MQSMPEANLPEFWSPEPIEAFRVWKSIKKTDTFLLCGASDSKWTNSTLNAQCNLSSKNHKAPSWDCSCGIYAFKEYEDALALIRDQSSRTMFLDEFGDYIKNHISLFNVVGQVRLSGVVYEYEKGYRAEIAEITQLTIFSNVKIFYLQHSSLSEVSEIHKVINELEKHYNVPVTERGD